MSSDVTKCQEIIEYQDCTTKVYEDAMKKNCQCLPFNLRMTEFVMFLDKYDYNTKRVSSVTEHTKSKHQGFDMFVISVITGLIGQKCWPTHKKSMHEGIKYFCDQCVYSYDWPQSLIEHKKSMHEEIKQC